MFLSFLFIWSYCLLAGYTKENLSSKQVKWYLLSKSLYYYEQYFSLKQQEVACFLFTFALRLLIYPEGMITKVKSFLTTWTQFLQSVGAGLLLWRIEMKEEVIISKKDRLIVKPLVFCVVFRKEGRKVFVNYNGIERRRKE